MTRATVAMLVTLCLSAASTAGGQTVTKPGEMIKRNATIERIDMTSRTLTLRTEDGRQVALVAPQSMARFNELKVGDKVHVTYYETTVYQLRKAGAPPATASDRTTLTPGTGSAPGGTLARQVTSSVVVKSVDPSVPSITVTTEDGRTITAMVANKANLEGVAAGDRIDITYTEAVLASVEPQR